MSRPGLGVLAHGVDPVCKGRPRNRPRRRYAVRWRRVTLAPVLTPSEPGERRSYTVVFPILPFSRADRQTASGEWAADMGEGLRGRLQIRQRSRDRANVTRAHRLDAKLASGHALTRPYAVACVTVAKTMRVAEFGRRLDASIRRAGFAPLRLDLAQDAGFAAATLPLGLGLTRKADE